MFKDQPTVAERLARQNRRPLKLPSVSHLSPSPAVAGVSAVAIKNVTINDNFFLQHFPERPIMPGVPTQFYRCFRQRRKFPTKTWCKTNLSVYLMKILLC
ncbi:hypothetical protein SAY86_005310 [Trapa natans]|uniref:Uncharacterized protein n=1 Tax=Trapa natans TaxID=22666 RepID=A0AAN7KZS4_TRANT|nr:hypothetical protein SAY86_005310 [Trapa natans]